MYNINNNELREFRIKGDAVSKWTPDSKVHPEELGEYAEGDILHPHPYNRNGLRAKSSRWPDKTIPYEIGPYIREYSTTISLSSL